MRNELVAKSDFNDPEKNKVQYVLEKSKEYALQRYEHPIYDTELGFGKTGWGSIVAKTPVQFTPQQFAVFRAVHKWRDDLARREDESPLFIMPNHALFSIGRAMPDNTVALFTVVQHVSHILRAHADSLVSAIQKAKMEGINGPDLHVTLQRISDTTSTADHLLAQLEACQVNVSELRAGTAFVQDSSRGIREQAQSLLDSQTHLDTLAEDIASRLSFFTLLPYATNMLSSPDNTIVYTQSFLELMDQLDVALLYLHQEPARSYRDASLYRMRYS